MATAEDFERGDGWTYTEDGDERRLQLETDLQVIQPEDITLDIMTRGCALLGIDADDVWAQRDIELPERPSLPRAQAFFSLVVENSDEFDLAEMQWSRAQALLAVVVDHFINASPR